MSRSELECSTQKLGTALLTAARATPASTKCFWSAQPWAWAMQNESFRTQIFRVIDLFPALKTPAALQAALADYMSQPGVILPPALTDGSLARTLPTQINALVEKLTIAPDVAAALPKLEKLWRDGVACTVDLLGKCSQKRYLELIETLAPAAAKWPANAALDTAPRASISLKISGLYGKTKPIDTEGSIKGLMEALRPILESAKKNNVLVTFEVETFALKDLTLELFERCCSAVDFPAGIAIQAYLRSGQADAQRIATWAKANNRQVTVRLVKGANWDQEMALAEQMNWPSPVYVRKQDTDANFECMAKVLVAAVPQAKGQGGVKLAIGTHNVRSIAAVVALAEEAGQPKNAVEIQPSFGMADEVVAAAKAQGLRVREVAPVGDLVSGMGYLMRRLVDVTAGNSWVRQAFVDDAAAEVLLMNPADGFGAAEKAADELLVGWAERNGLSPAVAGVADGRPFTTEAPRNFAIAENRANFAASLAEAVVPTVKIDATVDQAIAAVAAAHAAFPRWRDLPAKERSAVLVRAAAIMRARRDELAAIMIKEGGKPWVEADMDVCEGIDFCEYYARQAVKLFEPERLGKFPGEHNAQWHQAKGVAVVISPWNFPLAICIGMTVAALVTGNPVVVKPSQQTPGIAKAMCDILWAAGTPRDVLHFVPGRGSVVGTPLVKDPRVALIAFTGSKEVGLDILMNAGLVPPEQEFVKKVVCEMGGKNAIIIDETADLDEAVVAVRQSAFGYCGQKCSACSRLIIHESVHDVFVERLVAATKGWTIGDPKDPATDFGPIIDKGAAGKIREYIEIAKGEGKLELAETIPAGLEEKVGKPYVAPHIFSGIKPEHRLANEEVFGPVLAVIKVKSFDEALEVANRPFYKLTGGVFSRTPANLLRARREFRVGNLYMNRGITGALVGRQPFGAFAMSGVGTKAGGAEYLLHFVDPRTCTENLLRRGYASRG